MFTVVFTKQFVSGPLDGLSSDDQTIGYTEEFDAKRALAQLKADQDSRFVRTPMFGASNYRIANARIVNA